MAFGGEGEEKSKKKKRWVCLSLPWFSKQTHGHVIACGGRDDVLYYCRVGAIDKGEMKEKRKEIERWLKMAGGIEREKRVKHPTAHSLGNSGFPFWSLPG